MTGDRQLANERYYTACKCCLSIFTKIKLLIVNRKLSWCFLSLFYFLSLISAFVTSLIEAFALRMRSCLFRCVFCRNLAKLVSFARYSFSTVLALLLFMTMVSLQLYLLQTNSSFPLHLSEPQGMFNLGQICQNSEAKI